jgi:hypothetical protein
MKEVLSHNNKQLLLFIEVHPRLIKEYDGNHNAMIELLLEYGFKIRYIAFDDFTVSYPIVNYFHAQALPQERSIEFDPPIDKHIFDKSTFYFLNSLPAYRLFVVREESK